MVEDVNTVESVANWCTVDTRTGRLACVLEENHCFDGEMYADELPNTEGIEFREDQRSEFADLRLPGRSFLNGDLCSNDSSMKLTLGNGSFDISSLLSSTKRFDGTMHFAARLSALSVRRLFDISAWRLLGRYSFRPRHLLVGKHRSTKRPG